ncbi:MAG: CAP domain-containing protein [Chloroflexota bacterium]
MTDQFRRRARHAVARAALLGSTALLGAALLATLQAPLTTGWNQSGAEGTVWQLTNGARANNGLRVLQGHSTLVGLARWRSQDQVQRNYFDHTVAGTGYQVYHWYDTNGLAYRYGGENIGWNNGMSDADSPVKIHEGFMASAGHRANILNRDWTHGGIGAFAADNVSFLGTIRSPRFYTELFMQAVASTPPPPPPSTTTPPPPSTGGGGSTGTVSRPAAAVAVVAAPDPTPKVVSMPAPVRPSASAPLDGATPAAARQHGWSSHAVRALPFDAAWPRGDASLSDLTGSMRVVATAADAGFVQGLLGGVIRFTLS